MSYNMAPSNGSHGFPSPDQHTHGIYDINSGSLRSNGTLSDSSQAGSFVGAPRDNPHVRAGDLQSPGAAPPVHLDGKMDFADPPYPASNEVSREFSVDTTTRDTDLASEYDYHDTDDAHSGFALEVAKCIYRCRYFIVIIWPVLAIAAAPNALQLVERVSPLSKDPPHGTQSWDAKKEFEDKFHYLVGMKKEMIMFSCKQPCETAVTGLSAGLVQQVKAMIEEFGNKNNGTIIQVDSYYTYGAKIDPNPFLSHDKQSILLVWMWRIHGRQKFQALDFASELLAHVDQVNYQQDEFRLDVTGPTFLNLAMKSTLIKEVPLHEALTIWMPFLILYYKLKSVKMLFLALGSMPLSILTSFGLMYYVSLYSTVLTYSIMMMLMLCTALSFDYSLFTLSRYAEERANGEDVEKAILAVITVPGHVVVVSGLVLCIAYGSMLVLPGAFKSFCLSACSMIIMCIGVQLSWVPCVLAIFPWLGPPQAVRSEQKALLENGDDEDDSQAGSHIAMLQKPEKKLTPLEKARPHMQGIYYHMGGFLTKCPLNIFVPIIVYLVMSPLTMRTLKFKMGHSFALQLPRHRPEWDTSLKIQSNFSSQVGCMMPMLIIGTGGTQEETQAASAAAGTMAPRLLSQDLFGEDEFGADDIWSGFLTRKLEEGFPAPGGGVVSVPPVTPPLEPGVTTLAPQGGVFTPPPQAATPMEPAAGALGGLPQETVATPPTTTTTTGTTFTTTTTTVTLPAYAPLTAVPQTTETTSVDMAATTPMVPLESTTATTSNAVDVRDQKFFNANCEMVDALISFTKNSSHPLKSDDFVSATFHGEDASGVACLDYAATSYYRKSYFTKQFFSTSSILQNLWDQLVSNQRDAMLTILNPSMDPFSPAAFDLVRTLRTVLKDKSENNQGFNATVQNLEFNTFSGTSVVMDIIQATSERLPVAFGSCVAICFILIAISFNAALMPFILAFTVVLPISWSYGAALYVFEDGVLEFLGAETLAPMGDAGIDWTVPIFTMTIQLGLALDYAVFLFERIVEFRDWGFGERESIQLGLSSTGPIISAAGMIFALTMCSMLLASMPVTNQIGFIFVFSIIVDTFIVRTILVPAMLSLSPTLNYWPRKMPPIRYRWLDVEGEAANTTDEEYDGDETE
eukprot:TRINITY_DN29882_c0_g1_i1.p1 TRINITY_DN29882_c0_g1~~TRINITY_DN29882_c0_g1_i1.p1  ORF type:complete len:1136 (-),score=221.10 TRINITY_DN29882_c0_g1_i1:333-3740(-)